MPYGIYVYICPGEYNMHAWMQRKLEWSLSGHPLGHYTCEGSRKLRMNEWCYNFVPGPVLQKCINFKVGLIQIVRKELAI